MLGAAPAFPDTQEERALEYLAREVPRWSVENNCFSCHNNGDAARALFAAVRSGYKVPPSALRSTSEWLRDPSRWGKGRADASVSDEKLARIQFAAAVAAEPNQALVRAAEAVLADQEQNGSWRIDAENNVGSPVTWGTTLATAMTLRTLVTADAERFRQPIGKARQWLATTEPRSILDVAATLMAVPARSGALLPRLLAAQGRSGGWGPWPGSPPEPFDTAIVILALRGLNDPRTKGPEDGGRAYLLATQEKDGGWPGTTRPAGSQSYAQHISTSAWATLALLATDPERK